MSAFMVTNEHLNAILCAYAQSFSPYEKKPDWDALTVLGQQLLDANQHSVNVRYPEYAAGDVEFRLNEKNKWAEPISVVQALKLCHCLDYQSCEFKEWATGPARKLLTEIENRLVRALPGYKTAEWWI